MRGTFLYSLLLIFIATFAPALPGQGAGRRHEIQFRRNDYQTVSLRARMQSAGISKAILRVFSDDEKNGGLYFPNGLFPAVRPILVNWAAEVSAAEVPLWAWMGARKFAWLQDRDLLDREWVDGEARVIPKLDLFNPEASDLIVALFGRLSRQPVAGILIQDDLTLRKYEGLSSWGRASFTQASGLQADPGLMLARGTPQQRSWEDLKTAKVGETLKRIVAACRAANSAIEIGLNVHYEAPLTPGRARSWYAFDAGAAVASGIDFFYLMAYHRQMRTEMQLNEGENRLYFRRMLEAALRLWGPKLVAKLQVRDWRSGQPVPLDELRAYYDLIPAGVERVCFAAADPGDLELISQIMTR